ncbi:MAG: hypothetical protein KF696_09895 [Planctomycetes bacterium]|nr:hypothetical protein [Planctomycetota bacterium]MCW8136169.1 hypothetical protein [Planctomycetota bacterium]
MNQCVKLRVASLCLAGLLVAACGANSSSGTGGGGSNSGGNAAGNTAACTGDSQPAPQPTEKDEREAQVSRLVQAFAKLDADAILALFHPDHKATAEKRIIAEVKRLAGVKGEWKVTPGPIEEIDGRFVSSSKTQIIEPGQNHSVVERKLELVKHDGKWLFKFYS